MDKFAKYARSPKGKATQRRYQLSEKGKANARRKGLKRHYGLTVEAYEQILAEQQFRCAICQTPFLENKGHGKGHPYIDHDHGKPEGTHRGILCDYCNRKLAVLEDIKFVEAATRYLERWS